MNAFPRIGHVHLKVRDLKVSLPFYTNILGLSVTEEAGQFVFLTFGSAHHDIALNEVGLDAVIPHESSTGLYHVAIEVESMEKLKVIAEKLRDADIEFSPVDHGISKAIYFSDPDENGIEVFVDTRDERGGEWRGVSTGWEV